MSDKQAAYRCRHPLRELPARGKTTSGSGNRPACTHRASCRSTPNAPEGAHTSCPGGCPLPEGSRSRASTKTISPFSSFPFFLLTKIGAPMYFTKKYPQTSAHPSPERQLNPQSSSPTGSKNIFISSILKENEKLSDKNSPGFASSKKSRIFAPGLSNEPTSFHGTLRKRTVIQR